MPNCAICGAELPDNARFCSNCGQVPEALAKQKPAMRVSPMQSIPQAAVSSTQSTMTSSQTPPPVGNQPPPQMQSPGSFPPVSGPQPQSGRPNWLGNVPLRSLIIGLAIIFVVASGLGLLTAVARIHSTANSISTTSIHTNPACPNQQSASCKPQKNSKTPDANGSTVNLLFSGAVTGRFTSTRITSCGASGSNYVVTVQGKVSGTQYDLMFRITAYKGAGTYNTGQMFSGLTQQPISPTTTWGNTGNSPATAIGDHHVGMGLQCTY